MDSGHKREFHKMLEESLRLDISVMIYGAEIDMDAIEREVSEVFEGVPTEFLEDHDDYSAEDWKQVCLRLEAKKSALILRSYADKPFSKHLRQGLAQLLNAKEHGEAATQMTIVLLLKTNQPSAWDSYLTNRFLWYPS